MGKNTYTRNSVQLQNINKLLKVIRGDLPYSVDAAGYLLSKYGILHNCVFYLYWLRQGVRVLSRDQVLSENEAGSSKAIISVNRVKPKLKKIPVKKHMPNSSPIVRNSWKKLDNLDSSKQSEDVPLKCSQWLTKDLRKGVDQNPERLETFTDHDYYLEKVESQVYSGESLESNNSDPIRHKGLLGYDTLTAINMKASKHLQDDKDVYTVPHDVPNDANLLQWITSSNDVSIELNESEAVTTCQSQSVKEEQMDLSSKHLVVSRNELSPLQVNVQMNSFISPSSHRSTVNDYLQLSPTAESSCTISPVNQSQQPDVSLSPWNTDHMIPFSPSAFSSSVAALIKEIQSEVESKDCSSSVNILTESNRKLRSLPERKARMLSGHTKKMKYVACRKGRDKENIQNVE